MLRFKANLLDSMGTFQVQTIIFLLHNRVLDADAQKLKEVGTFNKNRSSICCFIQNIERFWKH